MKYILCFIISLWAITAHAADAELLHVSYDPTRELFDEINPIFIAKWKAETGQSVTIYQSHGGSGKQTRAVMDGLQADVVSLALSGDIDRLAKKELLPKGWQSRLPENSTPYRSTIVFMVRKGNPKHITDWPDLVRSDVKVITPNPKTSGGARWNYLAAWAYGMTEYGSEDKARVFLSNVFKNVPVLDGAARGSTITFTRRNLGDVLITWENEAHLAAQELGKNKFEIVYPSVTMLAEPPVAVVEKIAKHKHTEKLAKAYLEFLYTKQAQEIIAKHYFRPVHEEVLHRYEASYPYMHLVTATDLGGWEAIQAKHFADGGVFDQIYGQ